MPIERACLRDEEYKHIMGGWMVRKQSVDQVGLPILIYRQTTLLHPPTQSENTIAPVLVIAAMKWKAHSIAVFAHACHGAYSSRPSRGTQRPMKVLTLLM